MTYGRARANAGLEPCTHFYITWKALSRNQNLLRDLP